MIKMQNNGVNDSMPSLPGQTQSAASLEMLPIHAYGGTSRANLASNQSMMAGLAGGPRGSGTMNSKSVLAGGYRSTTVKSTLLGGNKRANSNSQAMMNLSQMSS